MTSSQRIEVLLKETGLSAAAFSRLVGYESPQAIYDLRRGRTKHISHDVAERIVECLPSVSRVWLLTGEGDMGDIPRLGRGAVYSQRVHGSVNGSDSAFREATVSVTNHYQEDAERFERLCQSFESLQQELSLFRCEHAKLIDIIAQLSSVRK